MKISQHLVAGKLLLIGGAADSCLSNLVSLAGENQAHIVILPHASSVPEEVAAETEGILRALGAGKVSSLSPGHSFQLADDATAVYMTGGDQSRLVELLDAAGADAIRAFLKQGGLVAGSSAGAAAVGRMMIAGGMGDGRIMRNSLKTANGLAILPEVVVDTHFSQRGRFARLITAVSIAGDSKKLGIGLDENTGVMIDGSGFASVYGTGHAWFFAPKANHAANLDVVLEPYLASAGGIEVACLSAGQRFNFEQENWRHNQ